MITKAVEDYKLFDIISRLINILQEIGTSLYRVIENTMVEVNKVYKDNWFYYMANFIATLN